MYNIIKLSLSVVFATFSFFTFGQSYKMDVSNSTYSDLKDAISLNDGMTWDDPIISIPIGFDFKYFNKTIDTLYLSEWGLGGELTTEPGLSGETSLLIPCGSDLMDRGYDFVIDEPTKESLSPISYLVDGEAGKRVFKLEWKNAGFFSEIEDDDKSDDFINVQLWLYEETGVIEIRYGSNSVTYPDLCYDDQSGPYIGFFESYDLDQDEAKEDGLVVSGKPSTASLIVAEDVYTEFLDGTVPNGTVFTLAPTTVSVEQNASLSNSVSIYPNPVDDVVFINTDIKTIERVVVRSLDGREVCSITGNQRTVNVNDLGSGVYSIEVYGLETKATGKLIKL